MPFLRKADLLNTILNEITLAAPLDWRKVVYYTERLRNEHGELRNAVISECWFGDKMFKVNSSRGPVLKSSIELFDAVDELYECDENTKDQWFGLGISLTSDGKYLTKFYYEGTPLLNKNTIDYTQRVDALAEMN
ncbi:MULTISPECIES: hypothetical protein [unclassified Acinetobacter]|jgi:hypothetical protein|uniref:hypothetical protein n=1 Tax=unclassified Acinetobacter TaxID=196816 RepID=UPI0021134F47|nr:hypothetical protein [Acinetobacter sp. 5862]